MRLLSNRMRFGHSEPTERSQDELAAVRVEAARRCRNWEEIEDDLVERPLRMLVSASTDKVYRRYAGATFGKDGKLNFSESNPLAYVVRNGDVLVLEPANTTWSEIVGKRTKASA